MPKKSVTRRWQLSEQERGDLAVAREKPYSVMDLFSMLVRSPRIVPELASAFARGVRHAVASNAGLVWVLDSERMRRVVPHAGSGAGWVEESAFVDPLLERVHSSMRVLDLGCGGGRIGRHVAPRVHELVCADLSGVMLAEARSALGTFRNVEFVRTHGSTLSVFPDASFDLVYAQGVLSYMDPNPALALLDEVCRILRPEGQSIINAFVIDDALRARRALDEARVSAARDRFGASHSRPYTSDQIEVMHRTVGLDLVERVAPVGDAHLPTTFIGRRNDQRLPGTQR